MENRRKTQPNLDKGLAQEPPSGSRFGMKAIIFLAVIVVVWDLGVPLSPLRAYRAPHTNENAGTGRSDTYSLSCLAGSASPN